MTKKKPYTFIDLFAGLGGFHLALQQLGCKCVFASELKEDLRKLYQLNFPELDEEYLKGDITMVDVNDIPSHDILCGGFPCQPFSQAGKRLGFQDEGRGDLFFKICEIIQHHRPRYIFLENVSNLKGHDNGDTWRGRLICSHRHSTLRMWCSWQGLKDWMDNADAGAGKKSYWNCV